MTAVTSTAAIDAHEALATLRSGVDLLLDADLSLPDNDVLLDVLRELEVQRRRLAAVDARVVAEIDARSIAHDKGARDTVTLVSLLLRVDPSEAKSRVMTARDTAGHVTLTGERVGPIFPAVALAMRGGEISTAHARIISSTIDALPLDVQATKDREIESQLLSEATHFAPRDLKLIARRLLYTYDQDGVLASDEDRARRRHITARQHADGTVSGSFHTDAVTGEALLAFWDAAARPVPGEDGSPDPRPQHIRRHDALRDGLLAVLRSGLLPATGGVTASIVVTMTTEQFVAAASGDMKRAGLVTTGHGALIDATEVVPLLGDAQIQTVVLDKLKRIEAYSSTHRIFSQSQRLAMIARDKGCTMPGCSMPPQWCESHHVIEHSQGGRTTVANGALLCPYHHRMFMKLGYRCVMIDGVPHWIAPPWIDPGQTPTRNAAHDPAAE